MNENDIGSEEIERTADKQSEARVEACAASMRRRVIHPIQLNDVVPWMHDNKDILRIMYHLSEEEFVSVTRKLRTEAQLGSFQYMLSFRNAIDVGDPNGFSWATGHATYIAVAKKYNLTVEQVTAVAAEYFRAKHSA